jgi:hypothetical protein
VTGAEDGGGDKDGGGRLRGQEDGQGR